jgi:hypothetical protein
MAAGRRRCPKTSCCWVSMTSSRPRRAARRRGSSLADRQARLTGAGSAGALPALARIKIVVDLDDKICPCCKGELQRIGEDEQSGHIPGQRCWLAGANPIAEPKRLAPKPQSLSGARPTSEWRSLIIVPEMGQTDRPDDSRAAGSRALTTPNLGGIKNL